MAFPEIDDRSDQLEQSNVAAQNYAPNKPNEVGGKVRRIQFTSDPTGWGTGNVNLIGVIPKGARLYPGRLWSPDQGTALIITIGAAAADGSGFLDEANTIADDDNFLTQSVIDLGTAQENTPINAALEDGGLLFEAGRELEISFVVQTVTALTPGDIEGYLEYVVD